MKNDSFKNTQTFLVCDTETSALKTSHLWETNEQTYLGINFPVISPLHLCAITFPAAKECAGTILTIEDRKWTIALFVQEEQQRKAKCLSSCPSGLTCHKFYLLFLGDLRWVARFGLMSQIGASEIEAPIGSLFQKYVSSTFMVKMRIDLGF